LRREEILMGSAIGTIIGLALGAFGFVVMRNPMKLCLLAPGQEGYYQRAVLDRWQRVSLRLLGVLVSLFGMVIMSAALGGWLKVRSLQAVSDGLLVEMGLLFGCAWVLGLILTIAQAIRGELFDWFRIWKQGALLGPIDVYPPITPAMEKESRAFTAGFCVLVSIAIGSAAYRLYR
jgi:hypothetical protein